LLQTKASHFSTRSYDFQKADGILRSLGLKLTLRGPKQQKGREGKAGGGKQEDQQGKGQQQQQQQQQGSGLGQGEQQQAPAGVQAEAKPAGQLPEAEQGASGHSPPDAGDRGQGASSSAAAPAAHAPAEAGPVAEAGLGAAAEGGGAEGGSTGGGDDPAAKRQRIEPGSGGLLHLKSAPPVAASLCNGMFGGPPAC